MRVTIVRFAMLRKTEQFENDRAEAEVELGPEDSVEDAYLLAQTACLQGLKQSSEMELESSGLMKPLTDKKRAEWTGATARKIREIRNAQLLHATETLVRIMIVVALSWAESLDDTTKRAFMLDMGPPCHHRVPNTCIACQVVS